MAERLTLPPHQRAQTSLPSACLQIWNVVAEARRMSAYH